MKKNNSEVVKSHFAYGEYWVEQPAFAGYFPVGVNWRSMRERFDKENSYEDPRLVFITNGETSPIPTYLHGFKIPDTPPIITLGSDATIGRVALCKIVSTRELVAIHY